MYLTAVGNGLLQKNKISIRGSVNDLQNIENFANTISNGNFKISGVTTYGGRKTSSEVFYGIPNVLSNNNQAYGGRIPGHSMANHSKNSNPLNLGVYDTGRINSRSGPRKHGMLYKQIFKKNQIQSFWKLEPR